MTLIKWSPFRELTALQGRMNKFMEDPFLSLPIAFEKGEGVDWVPSVDIFEKENALVLRAELPDMEMSDIDISVDANTLQIKGNRKLAHEDKKENYHRIERVYGAFSRTFTIPDFVSLDKIEATYDKGVLTITLPKKEEVKPKKIKIDIK
ncbi:MAG: Hsp20/alpha crystallin family protein [Nitrospirae bacterium]|nr:Hsp20/alpha crystallin family protein [Nitrospirota bacterium]